MSNKITYSKDFEYSGNYVYIEIDGNLKIMIHWPIGHDLEKDDIQVTDGDGWHNAKCTDGE